MLYINIHNSNSTQYNVTATCVSSIECKDGRSPEVKETGSIKLQGPTEIGLLE